jgi:hypothetical protein
MQLCGIRLLLLTSGSMIDILKAPAAVRLAITCSVQHVAAFSSRNLGSCGGCLSTGSNRSTFPLLPGPCAVQVHWQASRCCLLSPRQQSVSIDVQITSTYSSSTLHLISQQGLCLWLSTCSGRHHNTMRHACSSHPLSVLLVCAMLVLVGLGVHIVLQTVAADRQYRGYQGTVVISN